MRNYAVGVALLGLLTGCAPDWDSTRTTAAGQMPQPALTALPQDMASLAVRGGSRAANEVASLPDRGELLAYESSPEQRLSGKHSAYRVRLSETHAFNAAHEGGKITVPTPDGGVTTLAYERHIEHPDGNWSWIGRDERGADAVLTFGEKAVFGTIPQQNGESLRLTTVAGATWLAQIDRSRVAAMGRGKGGSADVMLPPSMAGDKSQSETPGSHNNITMVASDAAAAATTTVDVLLGYTNGYASALGGQSQAVTRLTNLVDVSNQAYANSGITGRLRLVGTAMVTYPDNTDNGNALEKLSGQTQTGPTTPDPAFAALRSARDTLGADLVALVRDFRTPENNGCGIAWLIGGGQTGMTQADAPFGYSVISDGSDVDESDGFTYFCRDESVAHELGHNMGQAHNQEDSSQSGLHAYSYGYRESSNNGFYTVMAYGLSGGNQTAIRYFANPNVNYQGRPTGVVNQSDNTRSMNQSMPIVATFRAAPVAPNAVRNDVSADGKSDLLWWRPGQFVHWLMNGTTLASSGSFALGADFDAIGSGDLDGNGYADIVWRNRVNSQVYVWLRSASGYASSFVYTLPNWKLAGVGDVNADGKADLLWSRPSSSQYVHWIMNGATIASTGAYTIGSDFDAIGTGDTDGNGYTDIVWRNRNNGQIYIWLRSASGYASSFVYTLPGWTLAGVGDVNADGKADLLWSRPATSQYAHWIMNGATLVSSAGYAISSEYDAISTCDLDGNGYTDIVWRNRSNSQIYAWMRTATAYSPQYVYTLSGWTALR